MTASHILLVSEDIKTLAPALEKARQIAVAKNASILLHHAMHDPAFEWVHQLIEDSTHKTMQENLLQQEHQALEAMVSPIIDSGTPVRIELRWTNDSAETALELLDEEPIEMVVVQALPESNHWYHHTAVHELFRQAKVPVLCVTEKSADDTRGCVLAAINVSADDARYASVNLSVLKQAQDYATLWGLDLHVVNAYPPPPSIVPIDFPYAPDYQFYADIKALHHKQVLDFLEPHDVVMNHVHIHEGVPGDVVARICKELKPQLLVMGSMGRTGLSGALLGNTAESILKRVDCDILAVRAEHYFNEDEKEAP